MQTTWSNSGIGGVVPTQRDPTPSPEDISITRNIVDAGNLLGIELVDHVVIAGKKFLSMAEQGMLKKS